MVRHYAPFGCPRFLFPDGFKYHACCGVLVGGVLRICPKYLHLVFNVVVVDSALESVGNKQYF